MRLEVGRPRVELTATEFSLLAAMARQPGRVFTRSQLLDAHPRRRVRVVRAGDRRPRQEHPPQDRGDAARSALPADGVRRRLSAGRCLTDRDGPMAASPLGAARRAPPALVARRRGLAARPSGGLAADAPALHVALRRLLPRLHPGARDRCSRSSSTSSPACSAASIGRARPPSWRSSSWSWWSAACGALLRGTAAPVGDLIEAAGRVEAGEIGDPGRGRGPAEVRSLARAFNAMSARLEETDEARRRLLADVSHELRTPLTVMQGTLEGMLDGLYPVDEEHLAPVLEETRVLARLVEDLRTLSLSEAGEPAPASRADRPRAAGRGGRRGPSRRRRRRPAWRSRSRRRPTCRRWRSTRRGFARSSATSSPTPCASRRRAGGSPSTPGQDATRPG